MVEGGGERRRARGVWRAWEEGKEEWEMHTAADAEVWEEGGWEMHSRRTAVQTVSVSGVLLSSSNSRAVHAYEV